MTALRDERHLRIANINILDDYLDAGVDRLLNDVFYRLSLAMAHDDALHAERNRLLDLLALKSRVLLGPGRCANRRRGPWPGARPPPHRPRNSRLAKDVFNMI